MASPAGLGDEDDPDRTEEARRMTPTAKVAAGGAAGAVTVVLVWLAGLAGVEVPPEVASAVTVLLSTGAAYLKKETV